MVARGAMCLKTKRALNPLIPCQSARASRFGETKSKREGFVTPATGKQESESVNPIEPWPSAGVTPREHAGKVAPDCQTKNSFKAACEHASTCLAVSRLNMPSNVQPSGAGTVSNAKQPAPASTKNGRERVWLPPLDWTDG